jgi:hypothetical protein
MLLLLPRLSWRARRRRDCRGHACAHQGGRARATCRVQRHCSPNGRRRLARPSRSHCRGVLAPALGRQPRRCCGRRPGGAQRLGSLRDGGWQRILRAKAAWPAVPCLVIMIPTRAQEQQEKQCGHTLSRATSPNQSMQRQSCHPATPASAGH